MIRLLNLGPAKHEVQNIQLDVRFAPTEAERRQQRFTQ